MSSGYEWGSQLGKWLTAGYCGHFQVILVLLNCSILFPFNANHNGMPGTEFKEPLNQIFNVDDSMQLHVKVTTSVACMKFC
jgi:hypothetical protein